MFVTGSTAMKTQYANEDSPQVRQSAISYKPTGASESRTKRPRLYRLPCPKCGAYYFTDEPNCPRCEAGMNNRPRVSVQESGMQRCF